MTPTTREFLLRERERLNGLRGQLGWFEDPTHRLYTNNVDVSAAWRDQIAEWIDELEALITEHDPEGLTRKE